MEEVEKIFKNETRSVTREAIKLYESQNNSESLISQGNGIFSQTQSKDNRDTEIDVTQGIDK